MVFHTAEHSRFSHSLGVYEVARRIISEVDDISSILTKDEKLITLCAALLHDIGHGPYSHAFEMVFNTVHEEYSVKIILDKSTEVNKLLEAYKKGFSQNVAAVINKKCYKGDRHEENCHHKIINSLISSQVDADRLDYLQRDAYNTGTTYGEIDLERIIRSFLVVNNIIAFKYTSIHALEDYLMSRYHMYWQVYYHPVAISFELILINLFKRVKYLIENHFNFKSDVLIIEKLMLNTMDLNSYLEMDEPWIIYLIKQWCHENDEILSDLSKRFLSRNLLKYITCQSKELLDQNYDALRNLFIKYNINPDYYLHRDTVIKEACQYYNNDNPNYDPILLSVNNQLMEITELSHIVKGIKEVGAKTDYKLYYPQDVLNKFSGTDKNLILNIINK